MNEGQYIKEMYEKWLITNWAGFNGHQTILKIATHLGRDCQRVYDDLCTLVDKMKDTSI